MKNLNIDLSHIYCTIFTSSISNLYVGLSIIRFLNKSSVDGVCLKVFKKLEDTKNNQNKQNHIFYNCFWE